MGRRGRPPYPDVLTPREFEVLDLLREGLTNEGIAERLGISRDGAKYHVSEILSKLGLRSRKEAARWEPEGRRRWWEAVPGLGWLGRWGRRAPASGVAGKAALAASALVVAVAVAGLSLIAALALRDGGEAETPRVAAPTPVVPGPGDAAAPVLVATIPDLIDQAAVWSPNGGSFAFEKEDGIYVARSPDFEPERIASIGPGGRLDVAFRRIAWSPDGERLAFSGYRDEDELETIYVVNADGSGLRDVLPGDAAATGGGTAAKWPNVWVDADTIAFDTDRDDVRRAPMTVNVETGEVRDVLASDPEPPPYGGLRAIWSPDRRWVVLYPVVTALNDESVRVVSLATGETWDLPGAVHLYTMDAVRPDAAGWLPDSSAFLYGDGAWLLAYVEEQRLAPAGEITGQSESISPDGRYVAFDRSHGCEALAKAADTAGMCVGIIDLLSHAAVSTVFLPGVSAQSGSSGLSGWIAPDSLAVIGPGAGPGGRSLWLVRNPEEPEAVIWQEEAAEHSTLHGVGVWASPDGDYAIVATPTTYNVAIEGEVPPLNYYEARVYEMR